MPAACFVTAESRSKLYKEIWNLNDRVLYMDTDSIIFKYTIGSNEYRTPEGSMAGEWEVDGEIAGVVHPFRERHRREGSRARGADRDDQRLIVREKLVQDVGREGVVVVHEEQPLRVGVDGHLAERVTRTTPVAPDERLLAPARRKFQLVQARPEERVARRVVSDNPYDS